MTDSTEETLAGLGKNPALAKIYHIALLFYKIERSEIKRLKEAKLLNFSNICLTDFPLIKNLNFKVDTGEYSYFKKISKTLMELEPSIKNQIKKIEPSYDDFKAVSISFLKENMINKSDQLLGFLLNKTYRPTLILLKNRYSYRINSDIKENYRDISCPVCGASADIGYLNTDGARIVVCQRCDMQWRYFRTGCSVCGTKSSDIEVYVRGDKRIYHCKNCGGSLPVIDMREKIGKFDPIVERVGASILTFKNQKTLTVR